MSLLTLPSLPGQGWSVKKTPIFSTRIATHTSGREVRMANYVHPLYQFELMYDGLDSTGIAENLGRQSLQQLMAFYVRCGGQFGTFLYTDPTDCQAGNVSLGVGDGSTSTFTLGRAIYDYIDPSVYVTTVTNVTINEVLVPSGYTLTAPNILSLGMTPTTGSRIAASFSYSFLCRFMTDEVEFENFMTGRWSVSSLKFRSVR
jgi:uncharacterized protein (TIGR02217 family)